ncbi:MAG: sulfotransferase [Nonomuraea sp.]|nr:sulfotransferase [Nonomuraea sp.]
MRWQRKFNRALARHTGFQIERVGKPEEVAIPEVRPPADPRADRLLVAPVFILSPVRSGSTLLRAMLNAHPDLHAPHELHVRRLVVGYATPLARRAMEALGHNQADLEHLLWDRVLHRELVRSGKRYIVDKTPANAFAFERLATCWPDARFVFLLRHPASIAQSWFEASAGRRTEDEAAVDALRYMKAVERARSTLAGRTVRYEELTAEPERELRSLCAFLGVPWTPSMIKYGEQAVLTKGLGDWKDKIRSGEVQQARELPDPGQIPAALHPISRAWGYLE